MDDVDLRPLAAKSHAEYRGADFDRIDESLITAVRS
jgi:hypothetical protein